ncbi:DNA polymerase subunit beta [Alicyclobacillaceae bacterium I2511]|nr:DNA polymerase subunit beta [Alicyclobacillaceae bacterium I2511]
MSVTTQEIFTHRDEILNIVNTYGVHGVKIAGPHRRGEKQFNFDLELLISFEGNESDFISYVPLQLELEELLHCRVNIISEQVLRGEWKEKVLEGAQSL